MDDALKLRLQFFDARQELTIVERRLPHWSQAGTLCFITWRTWDSLPQSVLDRWYMQRNDWLRRHGINPLSDWRAALLQLPPDVQREFRENLAERWNEDLDAGYGECVLRRRDCADILAASLRKFDEERYLLTDFVVMPNHVHLIAAFMDEERLLMQCESWKHFTATQINRTLGRRGHFWQADSFDHLVRSEEQFDYLRRYIAENPTKARLSPGDYLHWSR